MGVVMSTKAMVIVLVVSGLIVSGTLAMHGKGHRMLAKWMPAVHGR
jgi:hypothetical protein